jgi:hypothetical protein
MTKFKNSFLTRSCQQRIIKYLQKIIKKFLLPRPDDEPPLDKRNPQTHFPRRVTGAERVREGQAATALRGFRTTPFLPARTQNAPHHTSSQPKIFRNNPF